MMRDTDLPTPRDLQATEVAPGILWLRLPLPWALDHVNVYALEDGAGWTLVDTGIDSARMRSQWEALLAGPLAGRPVTRLIVTHHHPDHMGLAGWFQARGVALLTSRTAWLYARMLQMDQRPEPPEVARHLRLCGADPALARGFAFSQAVGPMPLGFGRLSEGDVLRIGTRDWRVRMGQGHAPDHLTLWSQDAVLIGDQVLPSISPNIGVYPTEPEADPLGDYLAALADLAPHDEGQLILPGHQRPFRGLAPRARALIAEHGAALDRLEAHLASPRRAADCFAALYRRTIGPADFGLALAETLAHLNRLTASGRARRSVEDGAWLWSRSR